MEFQNEHILRDKSILACQKKDKFLSFIKLPITCWTITKYNNNNNDNKIWRPKIKSLNSYLPVTSF